VTDSTRSVVVTGVGLATPLGVGREALVEGLAAGGSSFGPLEGLLGKVAPGRGAVLDLPRKRFKEWINTRILRLSTMTRQTTLGCIAASDAASSAGLPVDMVSRNPDDLEKHLDRGCFLGSFIVPPPSRSRSRPRASSPVAPTARTRAGCWTTRGLPRP